MRICLVASLALVPLFAGLRAEETWRDDLRKFPGVVPLSAPQGYRLFETPSSKSPVTGEVPGPATIGVVGFVEVGGTRFYLSEASHRQSIESGKAPQWISAGAEAQLPPLPRLLKRGPGEDPDSGETVTVEAYEEVVPIHPESHWPAAPGEATKFFPAALLAVGEDPNGKTTVFFQLFLNGNASTSGYPFAAASFRELMEGRPGPSIRLYSRPSVEQHLLRIAGRSPVLPLLQPGLVFLGGFRDGGLVSLALGGDAWSESAPVSRLGAPVFRSGEALDFGFLATEMTGEGLPLAIRPDRVAGADYTRYDLIAQMGAPFGEYSPPEFQDNWTLRISRDLSTDLLAPLYDGRGAPGMIELEGLSLDAAPPVPDPDLFTAEQFAAFRDKLPRKTDPAAFGGKWKSILEGKLGEVPPSQRVPETQGGDF